MRQLLFSSCFAVCAIGASPAAAGLVIENCLISPSRAADLSADATGIIQQSHVELGESVVEGDLLAQLSDQVERASVAVARNDAEDTSELVSITRLLDVERNRIERTRKLNERGLVPEDELRERELVFIQREVEKLRTEARLRRAALQLELAEAQLASKSVRAPFSGVIVERYLQVGEMASPSTPIFQLVELASLKVEVIVPKGDYASIAVNKEATVFLEQNSEIGHAATSVLIDPLIDPASGTVRVRLTLPNPGGQIAAGQGCRVVFATG